MFTSNNKLFTLATVVLGASTSVFAANHTVVVGTDESGAPANVFRPDVVKAVAGDFINFEFRAGSHSFTQAPFGVPCTQMWNDDLSRPGLDSNFVPAPEDPEADVPIVSLQVSETTPIWLMCNRAPHCQRGMVMVINPPENNPQRTIDIFRAAALTAEQPGYGTFANFSASAAAASGSNAAGASGSSTAEDGGPTGTDSGAEGALRLGGGVVAAALLGLSTLLF